LLHTWYLYEGRSQALLFPFALPRSMWRPLLSRVRGLWSRFTHPLKHPPRRKRSGHSFPDDIQLHEFSEILDQESNLSLSDWSNVNVDEEDRSERRTPSSISTPNGSVDSFNTIRPDHPHSPRNENVGLPANEPGPVSVTFHGGILLQPINHKHDWKMH
jgi:hypothetical protein